MGSRLGRKIVSTLAFVTAFGTTAHAQGIQIGQPVSGGSGCPAGTLVASLGADGRIHVEFDQYFAEAGRQTGRALDRKTCNVAIPIKLPPGIAVSILNIDYMGFVSLPKGSSGQLTTESFFVGGKGTKVTKKLPTGSPRLFRINEKTKAVAWSDCGADTILRVNTALLVKANSKSDSAIAALDHADVAGGIFYALSYKTCQ